MINRRTFIAAAPLFLAINAFAKSSPYPSRPVRIIVPSPPGGSTDQLARLIGDKLSNAWGQSVVVENKPGAGLTLGADYVAKSAPDGYTLLMGAVHHSIAASVYKKLPYDLLKDLRPISVIAIVPNVLVVPASFPAQTVGELIALAKANPGKFNYGSTGAGTAHHLIGEQFNDMAGTDIVHVPYKGSAPALVDLMGGQIQLMFDTVASCLPHIQSGKLRALAVATSMRSRALPDVPTLSESGLAGFDVASWFGLMAPAATPTSVVEKVSADVREALASAEMQAQLLAMGAEPVGNTPEQMDAQIRLEVERFTQLAQKVNLSLD